MKRSRKWVCLVALLSVLCLFGCRQREQETEPQTETAAPTEKITEKPTEKETAAPTEKESETEKKTTAKQTTVKPSTTGSTTKKTTTTNSTTNTTTNTTVNTTTNTAGATKQCPYCYQQISTAPDGNGSTIYDAHVAQEKNWADLYGYGDQPPVIQQTEAATEAAPQQTNADDDSRQCGYCYQWFSVSDGSYAAHLQAENQALGLPEGTEYKVCPICGNAYPAGSLYDNHVCVTD